MPVNKFFQFNEADNTLEQKLWDSLTAESISVMGQNIYFIPRIITNFDKLYGTDTQSAYTDTYLIECYLNNVSGFQGDKTFMSKFGGLEIRDQITVTFSISTFRNLITPYSGNDRPLEGDLIYWPLNKKIFQIKFVNPFQMYFPLGGLYTFECTCELFEYSDETLNTGIPEIDILQQKFSTNALDYSILDELGDMLLDENGEYLVTELFHMQKIDVISDNETLQRKGMSYTDFSESDPYSQGTF